MSATKFTTNRHSSRPCPLPGSPRIATPLARRPVTHQSSHPGARREARPRRRPVQHRPQLRHSCPRERRRQGRNRHHPGRSRHVVHPRHLFPLSLPVLIVFAAFVPLKQGAPAAPVVLVVLSCTRHPACSSCARSCSCSSGLAVVQPAPACSSFARCPACSSFARSCLASRPACPACS